MIKTLTPIVSQRIANSGPGMMTPSGKTGEESFFEILNLGYWVLFGI